MTEPRLAITIMAAALFCCPLCHCSELSTAIARLATAAARLPPIQQHGSEAAAQLLTAAYQGMAACAKVAAHPRINGGTLATALVFQARAAVSSLTTVGRAALDAIWPELAPGANAINNQQAAATINLVSAQLQAMAAALEALGSTGCGPPAASPNQLCDWLAKAVAVLDGLRSRCGHGALCVCPALGMPVGCLPSCCYDCCRRCAVSIRSLLLCYSCLQLSCR